MRNSVSVVDVTIMPSEHRLLKSVLIATDDHVPVFIARYLHNVKQGAASTERSRQSRNHGRTATASGRT